MLTRWNQQCIMVTDSQMLAEACNGRPGEAIFGIIVQDCVNLLKHINPVLVRFVYRSTNNVAHTLAKAAYSMSGGGEWFDNP